MSLFITAAAPLQAAPAPSLWQNILESVPTDPASLFALALCVAVTALVVVTGRSGRGKRGGKGGEPA